MNTKEIAKYIEEFAPLSLQEEWDKSGFQINLNNEVHKVLICLEITSNVLDEAIFNGVDLIVSHHPLLFNPVDSIDTLNIAGKFISKLITNNISVYSSHTPFDICFGGNNCYLGNLLGVKDITYLKDDETHICRMGNIDEITIKDFIDFSSKRLNLDKGFINFTGDINKKISKIAWCTGAGSEFIELAKRDSIDLFITGDLKYHQAILAKQIGLNVLDLGHFGTENIFTENMANKLADIPNVEIIKSEININPFNLF